MKKTLLTALLLLALTVAALASCASGVIREGLWEDAIYTTDQIIGEGETTFYLIVEAGDNSVTFTVKTEKTVLGEALRDMDIVKGEEGAYGLYIKSVNGILADYNVDQSWWGVKVEGVTSDYGVDSIEIEDGKTYSLVYSK